jgi:hypothetical protein
VKEKIITVGDDGYIVLGRVSVNTSYDTDQLKSQWRLADTILRNQNEFYICMKIIDVEFNDI